MEEARKYCSVNVAAKGDNASVPPAAAWKLTPGAKYVHYCDNETIQGVEFHGAPGACAAPPASPPAGFGRCWVLLHASQCCMHLVHVAAMAASQPAGLTCSAEQAWWQFLLLGIMTRATGALLQVHVNLLWDTACLPGQRHCRQTGELMAA